MGYATKTVNIGNEWTLVTAKPALIQFNDIMHMALTDGDVPAESAGFKMMKDEKYVNTTTGVNVWAKSMRGGSNVESVRVAEETII